MESLKRFVVESLRAASGWRPGGLARGAVAMTLAMGLRTAIQALVFVIVARMLEVREYGAYAAALALAGGVGGLAGLGAAPVMVRELARSRQSLQDAWADTMTAFVASMPFLFGGYLWVAWLILSPGVPFMVIALIGFSEIFLAPLLVAAIHADQGMGRIGRASWMYLVPVVPRFLAAVALIPLVEVLPTEMRLLAWATLYTFASAVSAAYAYRTMLRCLGVAVGFRWQYAASRLREGAPFALSATALKLSADIDKSMLAGLATLASAGAYSAAYRVVDFASAPTQALLVAAAPRFFREGEGGVHRALSYAWRLLPVPLTGTVVTCGALYFAADLLPWLLGRDFSEAASALRQLAWLPCIVLPRLFLQTLLVASDRQYAVVTVLVIGAGANIGLNLWLIPLLDWQGAVVATYVAEVVTSLIMLMVALGRRKKSREGTEAAMKSEGRL